MMKRALLLALLAGAHLELATPASAREMTVAMSRQEIRSMPITARPSRPGHFYGNAVRRNAARKTTSASAW